MKFYDIIVTSIIGLLSPLAVIATVSEPTTTGPFVDLSLPIEKSDSFNDSTGMDRVVELFSSRPEVRNAQVLQNGKLVGEYIRDDDIDTMEIRNLFSVGKTVSGFLTGILVDQYNVSLNTTLEEFFKEEEDAFDLVNSTMLEYMKSVTLYEILTMTSALNQGDCYDEIGETGDLDLQTSLSCPQRAEGVEQGQWHYLDYWNVLSYIVKGVTELDLFELLEVEVLPYLGIEAEDIYWKSRNNVTSSAFGGIYLNTNQMSKFGQLLLQGGLAGPEGPQIVSSKYMEEMTAPLVEVLQEGFPVPGSVDAEYGFLTFMTDDFYLAAGLQGQYIAWSPKTDLVVTILSNNDNTDPEFDPNDITINGTVYETVSKYFPEIFDGTFDFGPREDTPSSSSTSSSTFPFIYFCGFIGTVLPVVLSFLSLQ